MNEDRGGMTYGADYRPIPITSITSGTTVELRPDIWAHTLQIVNIVWVGDPIRQDFVLVDAGMPGSEEEILKTVEERFGPGAKPRAILLTHGHFDHVGALIDLVKRWKVSVYAHPEELPYLTGLQGYPPPDPTADSGWLARSSPWYPNEPIQLGAALKPLPLDGSVPFLPEFRWIHTPGHTPGHVSFYRERDRTLIAGDAFVTVKQESLYKVLLQEQEVSGPPKYWTSDWDSARRSVKLLTALCPEAAVTGHGRPMVGEALREGLNRLCAQLDELAVPDCGSSHTH